MVLVWFWCLVLVQDLAYFTWKRFPAKSSQRRSSHVSYLSLSREREVEELRGVGRTQYVRAHVEYLHFPPNLKSLPRSRARSITININNLLNHFMNP